MLIIVLCLSSLSRLVGLLSRFPQLLAFSSLSTPIPTCPSPRQNRPETEIRTNPASTRAIRSATSINIPFCCFQPAPHSLAIINFYCLFGLDDSNNSIMLCWCHPTFMATVDTLKSSSISCFRIVSRPLRHPLLANISVDSRFTEAPSLHRHEHLSTSVTFSRRYSLCINRCGLQHTPGLPFSSSENRRQSFLSRFSPPLAMNLSLS